MRQLQFLDMAIEKEDVVVPIDAADSRRTDRSHGPHSCMVKKIVPVAA